jgi:hypothetical protein
MGDVTMHPIRRTASLVATLVMIAPSPAQAQSSRALNTLGYGATGAVAGALATADATCDGPGFVCIPSVAVAATLGGLVVGAIIGNTLSSRANRTVAAGRPVGGGHLTALSVGTVLGGATVGLVAGSLLINPTGEGTLLGSDEQTLTLLTLAGATLGVLHLRRNWGRLTGTSIEVQPALFTNGRPGVVARFRF